MQERVEFECCIVRGPHERRQIVNQDVTNISAGCFASWYGSGLDPGGREGRCVFCIKSLAENAIREALERDRMIFQVREQVFGNLDVVVDDPGFSEACARIPYFVEVR